MGVNGVSSSYGYGYGMEVIKIPESTAPVGMTKRLQMQRN